MASMVGYTGTTDSSSFTIVVCTDAAIKIRLNVFTNNIHFDINRKGIIKISRISETCV